MYANPKVVLCPSPSYGGNLGSDPNKTFRNDCTIIFKNIGGKLGIPALDRTDDRVLSHGFWVS